MSGMKTPPLGGAGNVPGDNKPKTQGSYRGKISTQNGQRRVSLQNESSVQKRISSQAIGQIKRQHSFGAEINRASKEGSAISGKRLKASSKALQQSANRVNSFLNLKKK